MSLCDYVCVILQLQRCKADLDSSLPPPLDSVVVWLQRAEAALTEERGEEKDHADAAKKARVQQDTLKVIFLYFAEQIRSFLLSKIKTYPETISHGRRMRHFR